MNRCPICHGKGYIFDSDVGYSKIEVCQCSLYCDICGNSGYIESWRDGYRYLKKCRCRVLKNKVRRYNALKIPARYGEKTLDDFKFISLDPNILREQKALVGELRRYVKNYDSDSKGIIIYGSNGVGKTHLLVSVLSAIILSTNIKGYYIDFPQWIKKYKKMMGKDPQILTSEIEYILGVDILVIDEFAKNRTEFEISLFEEIFNERYNQKKTMLIGTNFEMTKNKEGPYLGDVLSKALFSRLGDFNSFKASRLPGEDYRING